MRLKITFALIIFSLAVFIALSIAVWHSSYFLSLDHTIYSICAQLVSPQWLWINEVVSFLGQGEFLFFLAIVVMIYLIVRGYTQEGIWYFVTLSIGLQLNAALKVFFERERPETFSSIIWPSYAYPSGHSFGAIIFYLLTWWVLVQIHYSISRKKILIIPIIGLILSVGATRVTLGAHWLTDVLGGFFLGLAWVFFSLYIAKRFQFFSRSQPCLD